MRQRLGIASALLRRPALPVAVSVVAGETIAGEAAAGTLRYLLVRPIGRSRLLVAKLVSVIAFVLAAVVIVVLVAYTAGRLLLDSSPVAATTVSGTPLTSSQLALRTGLMVAYIAWSMMAVAAVSFFSLHIHRLGARRRYGWAGSAGHEHRPGNARRGRGRGRARLSPHALLARGSTCSVTPSCGTTSCGEPSCSGLTSSSSC